MHIPLVTKIFSQYLGSSVRKKLLDIDNDERGGSPDEINKIIEPTGLDISYNFPDALDCVKNHAENYDLFIVDRNLSEESYHLKDIQKIDKNLTDEIYESAEYVTKEGDWLLGVLAANPNIDISKQFYFLTAYDEAIKATDDIKKQLQHHNFDVKKQIIIKDDDDSIIRLKKNIKAFREYKFFIDNREIIEIVENRIGRDAKEKFIMIAKNKEKKEYLNQCRQFFENYIIRPLIDQGKVPKDECFKRYINSQGEKSFTNQIFIKGFINCIHPSIRKLNEDGNIEIKEDGNERTVIDYKKFHSNKIIRSQMFTINTIVQPGSHDDSPFTEDTVIHVFTALKDIIRWLDAYHHEKGKS